ncbi:MAG: triphosphoribosyl-dephospho-CoA synthase [Rhizobiaceae bacterium]|nr:triphosphoribosyl-dephospho-CoA synthase [Rhizobiaceae bacterium]
MEARRKLVRDAFVYACEQEIDALKPGNVHRFAGGHGMSAQDFLTSARVSAAPMSDPALPVGRRILDAVRATQTAVHANTNLGILLLCAPVADAALTEAADLRAGIANVLERMTMQDTAAIFEAIATANPGGLGDGGANDVREPPRAGLLDAMREAANRDRIAYQYANDYKDIFETGLPALASALREGRHGMWPTVAVYMAFLTAFPDSHIQRKSGANRAESVKAEAAQIRDRLALITNEAAKLNLLLGFDESLKKRGINPGTSADLTVCCLFVHSLIERLHNPGVNA